MILIDQLPLCVLYHHFEVLILLLRLLLLAHRLMLNLLVSDSTTTSSLPLSDVFTHDVTHVTTVFILTIVDEAATVTAYDARVI